MRQSFCGKHIGRDLMIPLYILSAQTRKLKNNKAHTILYTVTLPPSTRIEKQLTTYLLPICFQLRVSSFFSFFFSRTPCTVPVSLIIIPPCRPQYGNHSTNLLFGNDEHRLYKTIYIQRTVFTVHEEVVKKTTSAPWEKEEQMQSLHLMCSSC